MSGGDVHDRARFRFTLVELLVSIGVVVVLVVIAALAIAATRARARSSQCQSHLKQICLAARNAQVNLEGRLRAADLRAQLQSYLSEEPGVWHCPSNQQPQTVSYGFNGRLGRLHGGDAKKIVGLDYARPVADVVGLPVKDDWPADVRARHFDAVNAVFYDTHVDTIDPQAIDPRRCENQLRYWTPTLERNQLPAACRSQGVTGDDGERR